MKNFITFVLVLTVVSMSLDLSAQTTSPDKGVFKQYKNEFLDSIKSASNKFRKKPKEKTPKFRMDFSEKEYPTNIEDYKIFWHNEPISQGLSGMCWCFSTTSFLESEAYRINGKKLKLSELHTVYWEYVEKARRYVRERGDSEFGEGSEANAVTRIWKKYGIVPAEVFTGLRPDQPFHDHRRMFKEMKDYLRSVKKSDSWNEEAVLSTIRAILDHYLGEPPEQFKVDGKTYTPQDYLQKVVKLNPDDYLDFMSLMEAPYYEFAEYDVPDNWWHSSEYVNVPLDVFMNILKEALSKGYTACIGGDVSEPGYDAHQEVAVVPSFDIPAEYIDENARQFRFSNGSTTDDHGIHVVGYLEKDGENWYLIKDSGSGSRNGRNPGYYFYNEDYIKLKIMNVMVHRDIVKDILAKVKK